MSHRVVLDNEAVQALSGPNHPKHRKVLSHLQVVATRKSKAQQVAIVVPTSVRVEAGWDRTDRTWTLANGLGIADVGLDAGHANLATAIRGRVGIQISVVDAHVGAVIQSSTAHRVTVITSDRADMRAVAETMAVVVVTI
ncbi:MAG: hypothetical protein ABI862_06035 [Ilumatobacteraceae bacterium]